MSDITMCKGDECPKKDDCYRHTANENTYRQSYFMNVPYDKVRETCDEFTNNRKRDENI
jgi:hypothetical protein